MTLALTGMLLLTLGTSGAAGSGPSGEASSRPEVRAGKASSLKLKVVKAPNGKASVVVRGKGGISKRVSATKVLRLPAGRYRIKAKTVETKKWTSKPVLSTKKVTLGPGKRRTVVISYWDTVSKDVRIAKKAATLGLEPPGEGETGQLRSETRYQPGTIVASGPSEEAPYGFLVEVLEVEGTGGSFTHQVAQAELRDAIPRGDFTIEDEVSFDGDTKPIPDSRSARRHGRRIKCDASVSEKIEASMSFDSGFNLGARWGWSTGVEAEIGVKPVAKAQFEAGLTGSGSCKLDPIKLWEQTFAPITLLVGPVPIVFVPSLSIEAGADASIKGSVTLKGWLQAKAEAGLEFKEKRNPQLTFPTSGPTLSNGLSFGPNASANLWLYGLASLKFGVYGLVGPVASVKFGPDANANPAGNPWWRVGARVDIGAKLKFPKFNVGPFEIELSVGKDDLISQRFNLFDSGGPFIKPRYSVSVAKTGAGTGRVVSASTQPGINCGQDCQGEYDEGTALTLEAVPEIGSTFTGWGGACASAGSNPTCTVEIDSAKSISADFAPALPIKAPPELTGPGTSLLDSEILLGDESQMTKFPEFWPERVPSNPTLWRPGPAWVLSSGNVEEVVGSPDTLASTSWGRPGSPLLTDLSGFPTEDAMELRMRVNPTGSTLRVKYVFATEEYPDYVDREFNDAMAITVGGKNCAVVPGTDSPVSVNTINSSTNSQYFIDNTAGGTGLDTVLNGLTVPLECTANVTPGQPVDVVLSVADASDGELDSAVGLPPDAVTSG